MYQVIIVEDDPMVAEIDKQYVEHNNKMAIAGVFQNGQDALDFVCTHSASFFSCSVGVYFFSLSKFNHLPIICQYIFMCR